MCDIVLEYIINAAIVTVRRYAPTQPAPIIIILIYMYIYIHIYMNSVCGCGLDASRLTAGSVK